MKRSFSLILSLSIACILNATTYYCSPNGNGNGNSYATPCSLSDGINKLSTGGDTLYLLGGQYNLGKTTISGKSGTSATNYMVISGYPGELAVLDFRTTPYGTRGLQISSNCTYLHIKDLTLRYSGKNNLYNEGSYCLFERLDIYGSSDTGCQMKNGGHNIIKNVDSHDNFDYEHMRSEGADFGGNADGFADKQFTGPGNHYIGCRAWNNSDDGWDFYQRVSNTETIIENCVCYQNGPAEYNMQNHPRYNTDKAWFDQVNNTTVTSRYGTEITVTMAHYPNMGNGNGFKLGGDYTHHNVLIHHCLAIANTVRGFDQNNNDGNMRVFNNTAFANGTNYGFFSTGGALSIQNNISYPASATVSTASTTVLADDHNTWNSGTGITLSAADFISLDTTLTLAARLANGDLPYTQQLFALAPTSDLIDAGTNVGLSFMGIAPDLGWIESEGEEYPHITLTAGPAEQWIVAGDTIQSLTYVWSGTDNAPVYSVPEGITARIATANHSITFSGTVTEAGTHTVTVTTTADANNATASATIHVKPATCRRIAWVTMPESTSDRTMLAHLSKSDSLVIVELNANDATTDYSAYDVIVISPDPKSSATGFPALKGYDKPMLVLKPFLFKSGVWNWGNAVNTSDMSISISNTSHPIFEHITLSNATLQLFTSCNTNAVTAINGWTNASGQIEIASPVSHSSYSTITEFPVGSSVGGHTFTAPLLMLGISEYSTTNLTQAGLRLVENAIYYLLDLDIPLSLEAAPAASQRAQKLWLDGQLIIIRDGLRYSVTGQHL